METLEAFSALKTKLDGGLYRNNYMVYFKETILSQIKSAENETEVKDVINSSIERLRFKNVNGHIIQRYIAGLKTTLHRELTAKLPSKTLENMSFAIDLLQKLHKP